MNLQPNLDRFNHELILLQSSLTQWHEELQNKETQATREKEMIKRQREELIQKSNLVIQQVNGLRGEKETAGLRMLEAEKLKKQAIEQLELNDNLQIELELREKNIKLLEEREKMFKKREEKFEQEKAELLTLQTLFKREQELLDEKQQSIVVREKRLEIGEAKQRRILTGL